MRRVSAAKFIGRYLEPAHEELLGGEPAHHLLASAVADRLCPPTGYSVPWDDWYASVDQYPLPAKARHLLDPDGRALPIPDFLTPEQTTRAREAAARAERIARQAQELGIDN
ncbi:hypothetical protein ABZ874_24445 [Streptomyces albidoflavus]|uniref:hypothetical protein n=1 Tax=Streptomyces albidoflavus TaxID=1886 RepID=UPI0033CC88A9